jgi:hypothetical protein
MVASVSPEHFREIDSTLLCCFARAAVLEWHASAEIAKDLARASPSLLAVHASASKVLHDLSLRLRCSPQARLSKVNVHKKLPSEAPVSAYDTMRLDSAMPLPKVVRDDSW